jgi:hypothetical protein
MAAHWIWSLGKGWRFSRVIIVVAFEMLLMKYVCPCAVDEHIHTVLVDWS